MRFSEAGRYLLPENKKCSAGFWDALTSMGKNSPVSKKVGFADKSITTVGHTGLVRLLLSASVLSNENRTRLKQGKPRTILSREDITKKTQIHTVLLFFCLMPLWSINLEVRLIWYCKIPSKRYVRRGFLILFVIMFILILFCCRNFWLPHSFSEFGVSLKTYTNNSKTFQWARKDIRSCRCNEICQQAYLMYSFDKKI